MRYLYTGLLLFAFSQAEAQQKVARRPQLMPKFNYSIPLGDIANKSSNISPVKHGFGGGVVMSIPLYKGLIAGLAFTAEGYDYDRTKMKAYYEDRFSSPEFYLDMQYPNTLTMISVQPEFSYRFILKPVEIEPYLRSGIGIVTTSLEPVGATRKMKNNNYEEHYSIYSEDANMFYSSVGMHVNVPIFRWLYGVVSGGYGTGNLRMKMKEMKTDFYDQAVTRHYTVNQRVSTIQLEAGTQFRFRAFPDAKAKHVTK